MADSDVEEQEDESATEDLLKWERQFISPKSQNPSSNGWSMVVIKDYHECSLVFPPINHENLHLKPSIFTEQFQKSPCESLTPSLSSSSSTLSTLSAENDDESSVSSSSLFSPVGSDQMVCLASPSLCPKQITRPANGVMNWLCYELEVLFRKVKGVLCSFSSPSKAAFTIAMVLGYLYFRWRRRAVVREENRDHFNLIIRQKDEKINQLLHQIARMNEESTFRDVSATYIGPGEFPFCLRCCISSFSPGKIVSLKTLKEKNLLLPVS